MSSNNNELHYSKECPVLTGFFTIITASVMFFVGGVTYLGWYSEYKNEILFGGVCYTCVVYLVTHSVFKKYIIRALKHCSCP